MTIRLLPIVVSPIPILRIDTRTVPFLAVLAVLSIFPRFFPLRASVKHLAMTADAVRTRALPVPCIPATVILYTNPTIAVARIGVLPHFPRNPAIELRQGGRSEGDFEMRGFRLCDQFGSRWCVEWVFAID
jgi:hypothetical protein